MEKNHVTIPKTMELRFTKEKTMQITKNNDTFIYNGNIPKQLKFQNRYIQLYILDLQWKAMVQWKKMILWKKQWYYGKKL